MMNTKSKKAQLFQLLPSFEGLTLREAAEKVGLSPVTIKSYFYELGGAVVGFEKGRIHMNLNTVAAVTQEGERQAEQWSRRGPALIQAGGLSVSHGSMNFGAESGVRAINAFQVGVERLSAEDDKEILQRIEREGTAGVGERIR